MDADVRVVPPLMSSSGDIDWVTELKWRSKADFEYDNELQVVIVGGELNDYLNDYPLLQG